MPEDNATESSVESLSSASQLRESDNTVTSVADIVETSIASFPTVSQPSELDAAVGATKTMVAKPLSTVLQSGVPITSAAVEKLLETSPARASRSNCYIVCITLKL